jgi:AraC-like DNA-binding protein
MESFLVLLVGASHGITAALALAVLAAPGLALRSRAILWLLLISGTALTFLQSSWDPQAGAEARRLARVLAVIGLPVMWGLVNELFGTPRALAWRMPVIAAVVVAGLAAAAGDGNVRRLAVVVTLLQLVLAGVVGCWLWTLLNHRRDDLDNWRRGARLMLAIGTMGVIVLALGLHAFGLPARSMSASATLMLTIQIALKLACLRAFIGNPSPVQRLFDLEQSPEPSPRWPLAAVATWPTPEPGVSTARLAAGQAASARQVSLLLMHVEQRRAHRVPGLSLGDLAGELNVPEHRLRALINHNLGFKNFTSFLNHYRLREVAGRLRDPAEAQQTVLAIAQAAGFERQGAFQRAFRQAFGMTPAQYRVADEPRSANMSVLGKVIDDPSDFSVSTSV